MGLFLSDKPGASIGAEAAGGGGTENVSPSLAARADVRAASDSASGGTTTAPAAKNKGGRPKGSTDKKPRKVRGAARKVVAMDEGESPVSDVPPIDPGVIRSAIAAGLQSIDSIVSRRVEKTALILTGDANEARDLARETALQKPELEEIPKLAAYCLGRHGLLGEYAPEVMLTMLLGGYAVRVGLTFRKLDDIARLHKATTEETNQPEPK